MLKRFGFGLIWLLLPLMAFAANERSKPNDKVYVQLEDLDFDTKGIWFKNSSDQVRVGTEAIRVDSLGYFVSKSEQTWLCPQCGHVNQGKYPGFWGCWNCGFPFR